MTPATKICESCHKPYRHSSRGNGNFAKRRFCSPRCAVKGARAALGVRPTMRRNKFCRVCKQWFTPKPRHPEQEFCSPRCGYLGRSFPPSEPRIQTVEEWLRDHRVTICEPKWAMGSETFSHYYQPKLRA